MSAGSRWRTKDTVLYRAYGSLAAQQLLAGAKRGFIFDDPGFGSTSDKYAVASQFFQQSSKSALVTIKAKSGEKAVDISKMSDAPGESEYLIDRNYRFKVVKYDPKTRTLEVEMLPGGHKKAIGNDKAVAKDEAARSSTFYERFMTDDPDAIVWVGMDEEEPDEEDEEYAK